MNSSTSSIPKSDQRSRSSDTFCSSNSSCILKRRKNDHPLATPLRSSRCPVIRQRVLSAKMLRFKSMQNKLNDANFHLAEVMKENQILKTLQKRQDKALSKYEGTKADLPRLLHAHEEEIRILTETNKGLKKSLKDMHDQIKHREEEIVGLHEQLRHYEKLNKDKHLMEREKLAEQVDDLKEQLRKTDSQITLLNRKLALESKNSKQKLNMEAVKYRQSQKELAHALDEIQRLSKLLDNNEKFRPSRRRFPGLEVKGFSPVSSKTDLLLDSSNEEDIKTPVTEVKLEPIVQKRDETDKPLPGILKNPVENIKARLSSASTSSLKSKEELSSQNSDLNLSDVCSNESKSRPNSAQKLEKISVCLENTIKKLDNNNKTERTFGNYCTQMMDSMKACNNIIENHKENLKTVQGDTDKLMETFKETECLEMKLKHTHLLTLEPSDMESEENMDLVSQILSDELNFKRKIREPSKIDKRENKAIDESRKRLLDTLKAIDRGENVDSFDGGGGGITQRKGKLMQEIFGEVTD